MRVVSRQSGAFSCAEFRALWLARGLSLLGDQLARVAVAVLVFERTNSPALTGIAYALTFLPYLAGPVFAGVADRRPRRELLIALDFARAAVVGVMAFPGMPLPVMCGLLVIVTMLSPVYDAARSAMLPELVSADVYPNALAAFTITTEAAQVVGFAVGGVLVAGVGAPTALSIDAMTFLLAGLAVLLRIKPRPAASTESIARTAQLRAGVALVFGSPRLRRLLGLAWLNSLWIVPEGIAAPYADALNGGAVAVGLLLAAIPFGCVLGAAALVRWTDQPMRMRLMRPLAVAAGIPLVACAFHPGLTVSLVLWVLCGIGTSYNVAANAAFVHGVPNERRGQAIALATTGIVLGQGLGVMVAGFLAASMAPAVVVGIAGGLAIALLTLMRPVPASVPAPAVAVTP